MDQDLSTEPLGEMEIEFVEFAHLPSSIEGRWIIAWHWLENVKSVESFLGPLCGWRLVAEPFNCYRIFRMHWKMMPCCTRPQMMSRKGSSFRSLNAVSEDSRTRTVQLCSFKTTQRKPHCSAHSLESEQFVKVVWPMASFNRGGTGSRPGQSNFADLFRSARKPLHFGSKPAKPRWPPSDRAFAGR